MTAPQHPLMVPEEVAAVFRVDPKTVSRWGRVGRLATFRTPGGRRRYYRDQVDAIVAGQPLTPEQVTALRARYAGSAP
jgi:predicted site-specific integrase-resolvase